MAARTDIKLSLYPYEDGNAELVHLYLGIGFRRSPRQVADQISDAIVDLFLSKDSEARIACETLTTTNKVVLAGEIRCKGVFENDQWAEGALEEIEQTVRDTVKRIGYEQSGFHWQTFDFSNNLHAQSAHIAMGVDESGNKDEGAGDQGIMFGYATDETPGLMPATLYYSHKILEKMAADRHSGAAPSWSPTPRARSRCSMKTACPSARPRSSYQPSIRPSCQTKRARPSFATM